MQVAYATLRLLSDSKFHSGTSIAEKLRVSRTSIWKGITFLRRFNIEIHAVPGRGYRWASPIELLDKTAILSSILLQVQPYLPRIDVVNVVPSTNDYLIQRLSHDIRSGTVCLAEGQTKGRGRMGREWCSPFGANIYLSLYWRFHANLNDLSGLSLVVGLGVLEGLQRISKLPVEMGIKWPNDIWYKNRKLAGILIETLNHQATVSAPTTDVIIGIGLNVKMPAQVNIDNAWADLQQIFGFTPSRNTVIAELLNGLIPMLQEFEARGFSAFNDLWLRHDLLLGKTVELSGAGPVQIGVVQGINERGELCIKIGNTLKVVRYGEVTVRPQHAILSNDN